VLQFINIDNEAFVDQSVDNLKELQNTKWEQFCSKYADRIKMYPKQADKISIPAIWNGRDWVWVSRAQRRSAKKDNK
jgi:heptaprenylglyceryl phosphate synthase